MQTHLEKHPSINNRGNKVRLFMSPRRYEPPLHLVFSCSPINSLICLIMKLPISFHSLGNFPQANATT